MKPFILIIAVLIAVLNISIPSALSEMNMFSEHTKISLSDFVEAHQNSNESEKEEETIELDEVETDLLLVSAFNFFNSHIKPVSFSLSLHSYIPSYIFSIFIPPSL